MMELMSKCQEVNTKIQLKSWLLVNMTAATILYSCRPSSYFADLQSNSYLIHSDLFYLDWMCLRICIKARSLGSYDNIYRKAASSSTSVGQKTVLLQISCF